VPSNLQIGREREEPAMHDREVTKNLEFGLRTEGSIRQERIEMNLPKRTEEE